MDDEYNIEHVHEQQEHKRDQQHVREIKMERVYLLQIVDQLRHHNLVVQVVVEVIVKVVIQELAIHIDGQHEVGQAVVQALVGHDGQHVVEVPNQERVQVQVEPNQEQLNV